MNSTLPPARDLPPHRRARIRARLEHEVAGSRRSFRFAPLVTAGVATAAVVALVTVLAPWQQQTTQTGSATQPVETTVATTPSGSSPPSAQAPVIPGLSPERIAEIEKGCLDSMNQPGTEGWTVAGATLHQYFTDEVGAFALLYSPTVQMSCTVDGPVMPYNASSAAKLDTGWLPDVLALDSSGSASGGAGGKAEYAHELGYDMAVGRVTDKVARVVYRHGERSVEARVANGTFAARISHPADWVPPVDWDELGVVYAYDAQGGLLGEWRIEWDPTKCWVRPDGVIVAGARDLDPAKCRPALAWR